LVILLSYSSVLRHRAWSFSLKAAKIAHLKKYNEIFMEGTVNPALYVTLSGTKTLFLPIQ
ncbi:MAG: hypothetical protein ACTHMD_03435, partial [Flavisolibacter sp.]